jgi:glucose/arabinose dehydrogenase
MKRLHAIATLAALMCGVAFDAHAQLSARAYASGFVNPVAFVQDPTDRTVQFVVEQRGRIRVVRNGVLQPADFLDIASAVLFGGEQGLLGLAFAPDAGGRFYVNFVNLAGNTVVARFRRSSDPLVADPASRFDLRWGGASGPPFIAQPFSNHKGGNLVFGPDGFLYIGLGDGGSGGDPGHRAQNPMELLGKMLRIDVNVADSDPSGYRVPADNPFLGAPVAARPEIWSFGLRNPWRYSFDDPARGGTGALVVADVGQNLWEEIDYEPAGRGGRNYGWRNREGNHDYDQTLPPAYLPLTGPIHEYDHSAGSAAIVGGYVYRGSALGPTYKGRYFFADFVQARVWSIALTIDSGGEAHASNLVEHTSDLGGTQQLGNVSSFGVDADGELYIVSYSGGAVLKVLGRPPSPLQLTWRNASTGDNVVWQMNGMSIATAAFTMPLADTNWKLAAVQDIDGDGKVDFIWRHAVTGQNLVWLMNGPMVLTSQSLMTIADTNWEIMAAGDLDGDGKADLIWHHRLTGLTVAWLMNGTTIAAVAALATIPDVNWEIKAIGDLDGDGLADVVWRNKATGQNVAWLMRGATIHAVALLPTIADTNWEIVAAGDLDGDGHGDLLWRNKATGQNVAWLMNGATVASSAFLPTIADTNWEIRQVGDADLDGRADLIWRHKTTGQNVIWLMNGLAIRAAAFLPTIADVNWEIIRP